MTPQVKKMMLLDRIKAEMFVNMKSGDVVAKEILRVAVGEITTEQARPGRTGSDEESAAILKKLIKSNEETMASSDAEKRAVLERENAVLAAFLPQAMDADAIVAALAEVREAIRAAGSDGQATGVAMKELKKIGANVNGKDVAVAVKTIRA